MVEEEFIHNLGITVIAAALFALFARKARIPTIVGYLMAGVFLGPMMHIVKDADAISLISEIGIALLLFLVGLELEFAKIRDLGKVALLSGTGQIIATMFMSFGGCCLLGFDFQTSLVISAALTFSSTVVVVKVLAEKKELDSIHGRIGIGVLLIQDLLAILLLTLLSGFEKGLDISISDTIANTIKAIGGMGMLLAIAILASRYLLLRLLHWAATYPGMLFVWSLCWCFLLVQIAHQFHLSHEIGAFLAGVSLAQLPFSRELGRRVHPLMNFFIAVFFTSMGMNLDLDLPARYWLMALALTAFVLIGKFAVVWIATMGLKMDQRSAFYAAALLCQISEFSLIFANLAFQKGLLNKSELSLLGLLGIASISLSSYVIQNKALLYRLAKRHNLFAPFAVRERPPSKPDAFLKGHIIVVGGNSLGRAIIHRLTNEGEKVLAIDTNPQRLSNLKCRVLIGDAEDWALLEEANLAQAKLLVSALHIEDTNDLLAYRCRQLALPCAIHAVDLSQIHNLLDMDVTYLMIPKVDGIKSQNEKLREMEVLRA